MAELVLADRVAVGGIGRLKSVVDRDVRTTVAGVAGATDGAVAKNTDRLWHTETGEKTADRGGTPVREALVVRRFPVATGKAVDLERNQRVRRVLLPRGTGEGGQRRARCRFDYIRIVGEEYRRSR